MQLEWVPADRSMTGAKTSPASHVSFVSRRSGRRRRRPHRRDGLLDDGVLEVRLEVGVRAQQRNQLRRRRQVPARHRAERQPRHRQGPVRLAPRGEHLPRGAVSEDVGDRNGSRG